MKYTSEDHPDYPHVVAAQGAMKEVALLINEQKRRIENMGKIGAWQKSIEGWKASGGGGDGEVGHQHWEWGQEKLGVKVKLSLALYGKLYVTHCAAAVVSLPVRSMGAPPPPPPPPPPQLDHNDKMKHAHTHTLQ